MPQRTNQSFRCRTFDKGKPVVEVPQYPPIFRMHHFCGAVEKMPCADHLTRLRQSGDDFRRKEVTAGVELQKYRPLARMQDT
ncbi:hypothetical protein SAMN05216260_110232 [Streptomyces griseoaurantiacus]|uniref:Uncharacterized protein n=1 Tax=Streptomyces griseoaurantiacus TaxID=68213 RepID=A0A1G7NML2_9ACTN|nr:hypothetical protein SAMN05216260_110232 [Streptomyces jietaisiensis]